MKKFDNIVMSQTEPSTTSLWLKDGQLYYYDGGWKPVEKSSDSNNKDEQAPDTSDYVKAINLTGLISYGDEVTITSVEDLARSHCYITKSGPDNTNPTPVNVMMKKDGFVYFNYIQLTNAGSLLLVVCKVVLEDNKLHTPTFEYYPQTKLDRT